ncbi:hypothetical protein ACHQM5_025311 [Ranunculus cassubicifolius]
MEAGKGNLVVMILVVMLLRGVAASYFGCIESCVVNKYCGDYGAAECAAICAARCTVPPVNTVQNFGELIEEDGKISTLNKYCKLGCASSLCFNLNGLQNSAKPVVGRCNSVCSKICSTGGYA